MSETSKPTKKRRVLSKPCNALNRDGSRCKNVVAIFPSGVYVGGERCWIHQRRKLLHGL